MIDRLHYISQESPSGTHLEAIRRVLEAGGKWIQLRVKDRPEPEVRAVAQQAAVLCRKYGARLIINDYPHIAAEVVAQGLHLGLSDMAVSEARVIVGAEMIIGGTANTFEHIVQRVAEGADYIGLGPYRFTGTKKNLSPVIGFEGYRTIMKQVADAGFTIPVIAIGGIIHADIAGLMAAGLHGVAVSGALTAQPELEMELSKMYEDLGVLNY